MKVTKSVGYNFIVTVKCVICDIKNIVETSNNHQQRASIKVNLMLLFRTSLKMPASSTKIAKYTNGKSQYLIIGVISIIL